MQQLFQGGSGEFLYNIAALLSLSAYIMSNVLWLRILLVAASTLYVIAGIVLGITSMSVWNFAYLLINLYHVIILFMNNSTVFLDDKVKGLYLGPFSTLTSREFKKLISINPIRVVDHQQKLIEEGETTNELLVILKGNAEIIKSDKKIAHLKEGDLIGEMSFMSNQQASADVVSNNTTMVAYWTHQDLEKIEKKNCILYNKFISIIGCDLVNKLNRKNQFSCQNS